MHRQGSKNAYLHAWALTHMPMRRPEQQCRAQTESEYTRTSLGDTEQLLRLLFSLSCKRTIHVASIHTQM